MAETSPKTQPEKAMFRRGNKILKDIPLKIVLPSIQNKSLLPDDEISLDGIEWRKLKLHPRFARYFQASALDEKVPKLGEVAFIRQENLDEANSYNPVKDRPVEIETGKWLLYGKSNFPFTVIGAKEETAKALKRAFDLLCFPEEVAQYEKELNPKKAREERFFETDEEEEKQRRLDYEKYQQTILLIIARHNLRFKEVDDLVNAYKTPLVKILKEKAYASSPWKTASGEEKEALLGDFKDEAIESFEIQCALNLRALFEGDKIDLTVAAPLIKQHGADTLHFYLGQLKAGALDQPRMVPEEDQDVFDNFRNLAANGLAIAGAEIPVKDALETLDPKEMWAMAYDLRPPEFFDKKQAIQFLMGVPDIKERAAKKIDMNRLFQLAKLPEKLSEKEFALFVKAFEYVYEVFSQIFTAIIGADFNLQTFKSNHAKIENWWVENRFCCPFCKAAVQGQYSKDLCPRLPVHIGCNCYISNFPISQAETENEDEGKDGDKKKSKEPGDPESEKA
ncbi:MAG: hypothetical protein HY579_09925 [Nitrospinae bacterium]|nr:hypothetical protein [Nitrospinota bacterium]